MGDSQSGRRLAAFTSAAGRSRIYSVLSACIDAGLTALEAAEALQRAVSNTDFSDSSASVAGAVKTISDKVSDGVSLGKALCAAFPKLPAEEGALLDAIDTVTKRGNGVRGTVPLLAAAARLSASGPQG